VNVRAWIRALALSAAVALASLLLPSVALAHGPNAPVATSFRAVVDTVPAGGRIEAKVVDGDRRLWLRVDRRTTLVVLGFQREPSIRFDRAGADVNLASPTTYLNQPLLRYRVRLPSASATPRWRRVTRAHTYAWHENRLHALERVARRGGAHVVGRWSVPIAVGGATAAIAGTLAYVPRPPAWTWLGAVVVGLGAILVAAWLERRRDGLSAVVGVVALAATTVARLGRELYGRPDISLTNVILAALTCLVALGLLAGLLIARGERRRPVTLVVGGFALYQGLTLLAMLTKGVVLSALSADVERAAVALALSAGVAALTLAVFGEILSRGPQALSPRAAPETAPQRF